MKLLSLRTSRIKTLVQKSFTPSGENMILKKQRKIWAQKESFIEKSNRKAVDDKGSGVDGQQPNESDGKPWRRYWRLTVRGGRSQRGHHKSSIPEFGNFVTLHSS